MFQQRLFHNVNMKLFFFSEEWQGGQMESVEYENNFV